MSDLPKILRNFAAFIDGVGKAGLVTKATPPELNLKVEEYMGGGMSGAVELSLGAVEKMEFPMTFSELRGDLYKHFDREIGFTLRGAQGNGTSTEAVIYQMTGILKSLKSGDWEPQQKTSLDCVFSVRTLELTIGDAPRAKIDPVNYIYEINGKDMLKEDRKALGL